jgi:hypothetical protein
MIRIIHTLFTATSIPSPFPMVQADGSTISTAFNILFGIIGGITLLFVVLGGFHYITSGGNPQSTAKAKDTILYALIGLTITVAATAIVNFLFGNL